MQNLPVKDSESTHDISNVERHTRRKKEQIKTPPSTLIPMILPRKWLIGTKRDINSALYPS
jgi:hypothetical protein